MQANQKRLHRETKSAFKSAKRARDKTKLAAPVEDDEISNELLLTQKGVRVVYWPSGMTPSSESPRLIVAMGGLLLAEKMSIPVSDFFLLTSQLRLWNTSTYRNQEKKLMDIQVTIADLVR
ncbi:hypothetical protein Peur_032253 [Populus x canadensis]